MKVIKGLYKKIIDADKRYVLIYGGAGTGKSHTLAQFIVLEYIVKNQGLKLLVMRKTNPSLRITTYPLITQILYDLKIPFIHNKSEQFVICNRNQIYFKSLDEPEKIKSLNLNIAWLEEATEFTFSDFVQVDLRIRREGINKMFMTFNPTSPQHWVYKSFFENKNYADRTDIIKTHYTENPFLSKEYINTLLKMIDIDQTYYKIYVEGEFATYENIVYEENKNYVILDNDKIEFNEIVYGLDFGYNNPTCLLQLGIKDNNYYVIDEVYKQHLITSDLISLMTSKVDKNKFIFCDSAEPDRIEELNRAGFNAVPAYKDVRSGIDIVKSKSPVYINSKCVNLIKELHNYVWKRNANGQSLEEPVKVNDHAVDALRYAIASYTKQYGGDFAIEVI
jgi:phage terminase large subunit